MCFSAEASFVTGAALVPVSAYCIRQAVKKDPSYLSLAFIPLLFGVQQFCEGLVWLGLGDDKPHLVTSASIGFLFFALAFWPFWIPWTAFCLEHRRGFRRFFGVAAVTSLVTGLGFLTVLVATPDVLTIQVVGHSIRYDFLRSPAFDILPSSVWQLLYLAAVSVPLVLMRGPMLKSFSIALILCAALSHVYFWYAYVSVWCYFAALLSVHLCLVFYFLPVGEPAWSTRLARRASTGNV